MKPRNQLTASTEGLFFGVGAYLCWGFFPLYLLLLAPTSGAEVLAQRVIWSLVLLLGVLAATGQLGQLRRIATNGSKMFLLFLAAIAVAVNWGGFIYGVDVNRVLEISLGYFINPLVSVMLGVVVLKERLRPAQWIAVATGATAIAVMTVDYGQLPGSA